MSKFIVEQIAQKIQETYETHLDLKDLNVHKNQNYTDMLISRCLAAYAISYIGGATIKEAAESITDGSDDNGIDGLFYNPANKRIIFVQSKYIKDGASEPGMDEIKAFRDGIYDFLDNKLEKFNEKINNKKEIIQTAKQFGVKFDIVLIYTGKEDLAKHGSTTIDDMMNSLNGDDLKEEIFKFHKMHKGKIFDALSKSIAQRSVDLEFTIKEWGIIREPFNSYYGKISGQKIGEWFSTYGDILFNDNIRKMLGSTPVNESIANTVVDDPSHFWYYNNGITLLAEKVDKTKENRDNRDYGIFRATKASIVNGAQTVSVIGKLYVEGKSVDAIEVPFRVIEIPEESSGFKELVTKYNNTQNVILPRDFISQENFQIELQKLLRLMQFDYNIKRDESFKPSINSFSIDEAMEGLVMTSQQPNLAAIFKKEIGRFYVIGKTPYTILFNPSITAFKVLNSVMLLRDFKEKLSTAILELQRDEPDLSKLNQVSQFGEMLIGQLCFKIYSASMVKKFENEKNTFFWDINQIKSVVRKVCSYTTEIYNSNYLGSVFQNVEKCESIYKNVN